MKLGLSKAIGLLVFGAALVVAGVAMVYVPAAFVLSGAAVIAGALWLVEV